MNGAESLLRTLVGNGIELCFMNPGTSEMQFVAALDRVPGLRSVLCLFEGVCSGAADGYARMAGKPAATLLHLGPGLANAIANFHNARKARSPIVNIVGEHSTQHLQFDAPLTADIEGIARPISGWLRTASSADAVGVEASLAIEVAGRHPGRIATLIIPADFSWSESGGPGPVVAPKPPAVASEEKLSVIASRLGSDCSFVLGGRTLTSRGLHAAGRIARQTGARIFANRNAGRLTSGKGVFQPERVPYFPEPAQEMLAGTKRLILVESQAPVSFFGYPGKRSYLAPEDAAVDTLAEIEEDGTASLELLADACLAPKEFAAQSPPPLEPPSLSDEPLTVESLGRVVAFLLPDNAVVVDEMISSAEPVGRLLRRAASHDLLPVTGGSIGQGLPVAAGAAFACPGRKVVALEADGSAMYTLQAMWTMAREKLNIVTVIFSNRRYRILDVEMKRTGSNGFGPAANDMIDIGRPNLDFVKLAEAQGVSATRATSTREFFQQFEAALLQPGPRLIEAVLPGSV